MYARERIGDYDETAGKTRAVLEAQDGKQKGDPQKAVEAIVQVVDADDPPLRLLLGASALTRMEAKLDAWRSEIDRNRATSLGADFPDGQ